jgi:putative ABC transport system permease protein
MRDFKAFVREHLQSLALPAHRETTIVEELAAQLEDAYDARLAEGLSEQQAWNAVQREIPDWKALADELLEAEPVIQRLRQPRLEPIGKRRRSGVVSLIRRIAALGVTRDLQSSLRLLSKDRGFTLTTLLTLAVCLAANVAVFTVVYSVLLRPLPAPESDRIVALGDVYPTITPDDILSNTAPAYFDRLEALTTLEDQALFAFWFDTITIEGTPQELRGMRATPSLFRLLQVRPALGRTFTESEGEPGADRKIVLSYGLWQRLFGGQPGAIGKDVRLGWTGQRYTIVGVMPRGFAFFDLGDNGHARAAGDSIQFWIPLAFTPAQRSDEARTRYGFFHVGRIRPGSTIDEVRAQVDALNASTFKRFPELGLAELQMYTAVTPLQEALTRPVRDILYLLWGGAIFVLLIGALNIVNLSLARASVRAREIATRLALGATRLRVTRQLVLEGVVLAAVGAAAGIGLSAWILGALATSGMTHLPNAASVRLDSIVVGVTAGVSLLVGVVLGLIPATVVGRPDLTDVLGDGSRNATGGRATRHVRRAMVVTQVAFSVVLLIGAGLLFTSFRNLMGVDAGFERERVTTATIFPPPSRYPDERAVVALSDRLLESIGRIPRVEAAGLTSNIALSGRTSPATVSAADREPTPGEALVLPSVVSVTPGYFEAMGTRLVRGRYFGRNDREHTLRVAIVDERLAARLWPNEDPIGKALRRGDSDRYTVVGVVREVRFEGLTGQTESIGTAYFPHAQAPPTGRLRWMAIKAPDSAAVVPALRSALTAIDPDLPLSDIQTMSERTAASLVPQKLAMSLATGFGIVALFLSAIGVYGLLTYLVAQRRREIGIRIAVGSTAGGIFRLVFSEGLVLVVAGLTLGVLGAAALGRALQAHVFGVTPRDPFVLAVVALSTAAIALAACVSPARRAARVDPLRVLSGQ